MSIPAYLILLALLLVSERGAPRAQGIPEGVLVQSVTCAADPKQSYALCVPSTYTDDKKWPILYCFDPSAVGSAPVANFKDGAEEYGYIVTGSNNSQNGPGNVAREAIVAMWEDTHLRFKIDDNRVYATGFSGGARVAIGFGYAFEGKVAGVIACGAGFPSNLTPSRSTPFAVFATVGLEDFNYPELVRLEKLLDAAGVPNRLRRFDGQHQWAPKEICTESIEWMQVQAMQSGKLEKNAALIDKLFAKGSAAALGYESSSKPYEAFVRYRLACAYSLTRQKSKALEALRKAVEKGFADVHALESSPELEGIRADPAFRQVLDNLKAKKQT